MSGSPIWITEEDVTAMVSLPQAIGALERVLDAGEEIVRISLEAGGVLTGEHGVGLEKRQFMSLQFSEEDLEAQDRLRRAFDVFGIANPSKVLPMGASCGHVANLGRAPEGTWV